MEQNNQKFYAGIGSRKCPNDIMQEMTRIAGLLQDKYTLRSGAAIGADTAFEDGVTNDNKEIYIIKKNYKGNKSSLCEVSEKAIEFTSHFHPVWHVLNQDARLMMGRNVYQIIGYDMNTPSEFVLCWTPDGCESKKQRSIKTGGTAQAIIIAEYCYIPVINMKNPMWQERLEQIIGFEI